jgi:hypothetical protein
VAAATRGLVIGLSPDDDTLSPKSNWAEENDVTDPTRHRIIEHWVNEVDEDKSSEKTPVAKTAS